MNIELTKTDETFFIYIRGDFEDSDIESDEDSDDEGCDKLLDFTDLHDSSLDFDKGLTITRISIPYSNKEYTIRLEGFKFSLLEKEFNEKELFNDENWALTFISRGFMTEEDFLSDKAVYNRIANFILHYVKAKRGNVLFIKRRQFSENCRIETEDHESFSVIKAMDGNYICGFFIVWSTFETVVGLRARYYSDENYYEQKFNLIRRYNTVDIIGILFVGTDEEKLAQYMEMIYFEPPFPKEYVDLKYHEVEDWDARKKYKHIPPPKSFAELQFKDQYLIDFPDAILPKDDPTLNIRQNEAAKKIQKKFREYLYNPEVLLKKEMGLKYLKKYESDQQKIEEYDELINLEKSKHLDVCPENSLSAGLDKIKVKK